MAHNRRPLLLLAVLLALASACSDVAGEAQEDLAEPFGQRGLTLAGDGEEVKLSAYVADTAELRRRGLMGWESMPDDTGMLFVYEDDSTGGFWMKDTLLELSIAFASADGTVHTVMEMEPCERSPCPSYAPDEPYRYALEVERGVFEDIGLEPGWTLGPVRGP